MATPKVIVVDATSSVIQSADQLGKLAKKHTMFSSYACGPLGLEVIPGAVNATPETLPEKLGAAMGPILVSLGEAAFVADFAKIIEASDRHSFVVVCAKNCLIFAGNAANRITSEQMRPCSANDVLPTLAYMFGYPVPENCTGSILYQGLKDPNMPHTAMAKLQDVIAHMQAAMERDSRAPWDKHDCA